MFKKVKLDKLPNVQNYKCRVCLPSRFLPHSSTVCFNLFGTKKLSVAAEEILIFLLLLWIEVG